eukprot:9715629-Alexandrium_andersonii.AAC.1
MTAGCSQGKEATELPSPPRPPMPSATPTQKGAEVAGRNPFEPRGTCSRISGSLSGVGSDATAGLRSPLVEE